MIGARPDEFSPVAPIIADPSRRVSRAGPAFFGMPAPNCFARSKCGVAKAHFEHRPKILVLHLDHCIVGQAPRE